mgnify:CR=1 FL=1
MTDRITATAPSQAAVDSSIPILALLALAMTAFLALLSETLPAGLLPQIAQGLGISEVMTGQLVTVYAIGSILTAIPLTALTSTWRRRNVLLLAIIGFLIFNTATALAPNYMVALVARFVTGMAAGLAWGRVAAATVVYQDLGISEGMQQGIDRAIAEGRPVERRWLQDSHNETGAADGAAPSK